MNRVTSRERERKEERERGEECKRDKGKSQLIVYSFNWKIGFLSTFSPLSVQKLTLKNIPKRKVKDRERERGSGIGIGIGSDREKKHNICFNTSS